jgi:hypothetical protein
VAVEPAAQVLSAKALGQDKRRRTGGVYWHPYQASASPPGPKAQDSHNELQMSGTSPLHLR